MMDTQKQVRWTATEMGCLWTTYLNDSMAVCVLSYFAHKAEDREIKSVIEFALDIAKRDIRELETLFASENFPIPAGFSENDVHVNAKRLFTDNFFLIYLKNMGKVGLASFSLAYTMASRADVRMFFLDCLNRTETLDQKATLLLQSKGLYVRPPAIPTPKNVDFVHDKQFLSGGLFGLADKRPLLSMEIAHLFANIQTNSLGKALLMGFGQVVHSKEVQQYLARGKYISAKHVKEFSEPLIQNDLPAPVSWDGEVTDSAEAPFSDRLMLCHISLLIAAGTANYGVAAAVTMRKDLSQTYVRLTAEIATYAADGAKLLIENGWLEEPPQATDRQELSRA